MTGINLDKENKRVDELTTGEKIKHPIYGVLEYVGWIGGAANFKGEGDDRIILTKGYIRYRLIS